MLGLDPSSKGDLVDNVKTAIEHADYVIAVNDESGTLMADINANKEIKKTFEQSNYLVVDIPKNSDGTIWLKVADDIEAALRNL